MEPTGATGLLRTDAVRVGCVILTIVAGLQATAVQAAQEPAAPAPAAEFAPRLQSSAGTARASRLRPARGEAPDVGDVQEPHPVHLPARVWPGSEDRLVGFAEEIEKFTRTHELGDVIWPSYSTLFANNLCDLADEIKRRDLYLFDIWGYVPGSGPGGYWQQFTPPAGALAMLESKLGDRWLGTDIGEQDGRYIGGYANQMTPASASRFEQYLNFQRHFERMGDDLGNKHAALVSLNFGHYFLKEGTYTLIGAETAQALPNSQVYYAFIRGAGRQYGVPWFGNASIYNRWGYKTYGSSGGSGGDTHGPTKGTSLSLLETAALLAHSLQLRRRRLRERLVRGRQAFAHRPHPAIRATLGEGERPAGRHAYAGGAAAGLLLRLVVSAPSLFGGRLSRLGQPAL